MLIVYFVNIISHASLSEGVSSGGRGGGGELCVQSLRLCVCSTSSYIQADSRLKGLKEGISDQYGFSAVAAFISATPGSSPSMQATFRPAACLKD